MRLLPFLFSILFISPALAQEEPPDTIIPYAKNILDTLCSPYMFGRGYLKQGDKNAAGFLKNELMRIGVKPVKDTYLQSFSMPVNTFPGNVMLSLDGKLLLPGKDFIPDPASPPCKDHFTALKITPQVFRNAKKWKRIKKMNLAAYALIVDPEKLEKDALKEFMNAVHSLFPGIIINLREKLTFGVSTQVKKIPEFDILYSAFTGNPKLVAVDLATKYEAYYPTQNVLGCIEGSKFKDSFIVFSAHYDHLGGLGPDVYFPGANDNASGCAMLLSLARYFSLNKPSCSVLFIFFAAEEAGLIGSEYFTTHPLVSLKKIKFLINMDLVGTGDEGITVVNATEFEREFKQIMKYNAEKSYLVNIKSRGKAANSDHYWFSEKGVRAFFIYTLGGIKAYHDVYDVPKTLPLSEFKDLYLLLIRFEGFLENMN